MQYFVSGVKGLCYSRSDVFSHLWSAVAREIHFIVGASVLSQTTQNFKKLYTYFQTQLRVMSDNSQLYNARGAHMLSSIIRFALLINRGYYNLSQSLCHTLAKQSRDRLCSILMSRPVLHLAEGKVPKKRTGHATANALPYTKVSCRWHAARTLVRTYSPKAATHWPDFLSFTYPSPIWRPQWGGSPCAIRFVFGIGKLEWLGYNLVKVPW